MVIRTPLVTSCSRCEIPLMLSVISYHKKIWNLVAPEVSTLQHWIKVLKLLLELLCHVCFLIHSLSACLPIRPIRLTHEICHHLSTHNIIMREFQKVLTSQLIHCDEFAPDRACFHQFYLSAELHAHLRARVERMNQNGVIRKLH